MIAKSRRARQGSRTRSFSALVLLLAAVSGQLGCGVESEEGAACEERCLRDADCGPGLSCYTGACVPSECSTCDIGCFFERHFGAGDSYSCTFSLCWTELCGSPSAFECSDDLKCIPEDWRCDGLLDCDDGSDELGCGGGCSSSQYDCGGGSCIPARDRCDGVTDCANGADEVGCSETCTDGSYECQGLHLFYCSDGRLDDVDCGQDCRDAGFAMATGCGFDSSLGRDVCTCQFECFPGAYACDGLEISHCCEEGETALGCDREGTWVRFDCDEVCRQAGYSGADACGFDEEKLHEACFCYE